MAKKCLTTAAKKGVFIQNANHKDVFNLMPDPCANLPFSYFRISKPIQPNLIEQGAIYIAESYIGIKKVLFTGLKTTKQNGIFAGDIYDTQTRVKSLILFCAEPDKLIYTIYLFEGLPPKSLNKVLKEF